MPGCTSEVAFPALALVAHSLVYVEMVECWMIVYFIHLHMSVLLNSPKLAYDQVMSEVDLV